MFSDTDNDHQVYFKTFNQILKIIVKMQLKSYLRRMGLKIVRLTIKSEGLASLKSYRGNALIAYAHIDLIFYITDT